MALPPIQAKEAKIIPQTATIEKMIFMTFPPSNLCERSAVRAAMSSQLRPPSHSLKSSGP